MVLASDRTGHFEIFLFTLETEELAQITAGDDAKRDPYISGSGVRIAYSGDSDPGPDVNWDIYTMLSDGGNVVKVTSGTEEDRRPSYNPGATQMVYMTNRNGNWDIYLTNLVGSMDVQLTTNAADDRDPIFSPDGSKIYFSTNRSGTSEIWRMNPDGTDQELVQSGPGELTSPMIGPDGKLYAASLQFGRNQIYRFNLANGAVEQLTTTGDNTDPQPLNDEFIRFTSDRTGNLEAFTLKISTSLQERHASSAFAEVIR